MCPFLTNFLRLLPNLLSIKRSGTWRFWDNHKDRPMTFRDNHPSFHFVTSIFNNKNAITFLITAIILFHIIKIFSQKNYSCFHFYQGGLCDLLSLERILIKVYIYTERFTTLSLFEIHSKQLKFIMSLSLIIEQHLSA